MKKQNDIQLCEVLNLSKIKKKCPQIIHHCEICEGVIIDHDNVPEEYIVDYSDRQIYSAAHVCVKCGAEVCDNCVEAIDDTWEKIFICKDCYNKYQKRVDHIRKLQTRIGALAEEIEEEIKDFLNDD